MQETIIVDKVLFQEANVVLDEFGIEVETVVKIMLKKIVKENSISFLFSEKGVVDTMKTAEAHLKKDTEGRMTKRQAVSLFESYGIRFSKNVTFASKNSGAYNYWANPFFVALHQDWYLILNDWIKKEMHLFYIPANAIQSEQLLPRGDQKEKIDLQICYNDPTYTDNRSKLSFAKYHVKDVQY